MTSKLASHIDSFTVTNRDLLNKAFAHAPMTIGDSNDSEDEFEQVAHNMYLRVNRFLMSTMQPTYEGNAEFNDLARLLRSMMGDKH